MTVVLSDLDLSLSMKHPLPQPSCRARYSKYTDTAASLFSLFVILNTVHEASGSNSHADSPQIFIRHKMQYQISKCWQFPVHQAGLPLFGKVNRVYSSSHSLHKAGTGRHSAFLDAFMVLREMSQVIGSARLDETFKIIQSNHPSSTTTATPKPHHPLPDPDTLKHLQKLWLHHLPGQHLSMPDHPNTEMVLIPNLNLSCLIRSEDSNSGNQALCSLYS